MTTVVKNIISIEGYKVSDIYNEAKPLDIILFNNKEFSLTSWLIKIGTFSGFNHAALVMDAPPDTKSENGQTSVTDTPPETSDTSSKLGDKPKYLYEYAGNGQPVTYQKLEDKLVGEKFNSITLIRLGEIDKYFSDEKDLENALIKIKEDFEIRMGFSSDDWKKIEGIDTSWRKFLVLYYTKSGEDRQKMKSSPAAKKWLNVPIDDEAELTERQKKSLIEPYNKTKKSETNDEKNLINSKKPETKDEENPREWKELPSKERRNRIKKLKYHYLGIMQLLFMKLGFFFSIILIILSLFVVASGISFAFWPYSVSSIVYISISIIIGYVSCSCAWLILHFKYSNRDKDCKDKSQICSSYPPEVIKMIMETKGANEKNKEDNKNKCVNKETVEEFARKWYRGTPPSPQSLYNLAKVNEGCKIFDYNQLNLKSEKYINK